MKNEIRIVFTKDRLYDSVFIHDVMSGTEETKRVLNEINEHIESAVRESLLKILNNPGGLNYSPLIESSSSEKNWRISEINLTFESK